jgi:hypothetical protein
MLERKPNPGVPNPDQLWKPYDEFSYSDSTFNVVKSLVKSIISSILKLEADFRDEDNFQDLGMNSLMMIEMKNSVQSMLGKLVRSDSYRWRPQRCSRRESIGVSTYRSHNRGC